MGRNRTVCIYGAASDEIDPVYPEAVEQLARMLARRGFSLIYGGGGTGLMGAAARGFHAEGAHITGVVSVSVERYENTFDAMERLRCEGLAMRKEIMEEHADAFVVLPGGVGTVDELFNVLARIAVLELDKPVALFNVSGFYNTLLTFMQELVDKGFMSKERLEALAVFDNPDDLVSFLES